MFLAGRSRFTENEPRLRLSRDGKRIQHSPESLEVLIVFLFCNFKIRSGFHCALSTLWKCTLGIIFMFFKMFLFTHNLELQTISVLMKDVHSLDKIILDPELFFK